ncbi:MAG: response regulator [Synergistaceae bacterium]|jgi:signal transduction histidine kinase/CheY-like chemotaxis protein|nr:response regulator [Synergistaceae bacterium]
MPDDIDIREKKINELTKKNAELAELLRKKEREQCEQFREILDSTPITMAILKDGFIKTINDNGTKMLGRRSGDRTDEIFADETRLKHALKAITEGKSVERWPVAVYGAKGEILDVIMSIRPFMYEDEEALLIWCYDVTELTRERRTAEEVDRAKNNFLMNMSHELRTPLNAIQGMSHLCLKTPLDDKQRNYLIKIKNASDTLLGLIGDVLDLAKMEAGNFSLCCGPFNIRATLFHIRDHMALMASEKKIFIDITLDDGVPQMLMGDSLRLKQVIVNLIDNAIKFTDHGQISVTARYKNGKYLCISVKDTGIGMTEDQIKNLFKPFEQAEAVLTRKHGGAGLGLPIVSNIVDAMGGHIRINSAPGEGTEFYFETMMAALSSAFDSDSAHIHSDTGSGEDYPFSGEINARILLVEDNEINQEIAIELLRLSGSNADIANNGLEALKSLEKNRYDLVLMDIQMPDMDGLTATKLIREQMGLDRDRLPIIAMSAHSRQEDIELSIAVGMNDYLTKPIDPEKLLSTLKKWTGRAIET